MQSKITVQGNLLIVTMSGERPRSDVDALNELSTTWFRVAEARRLHRLGHILLLSSVTGAGSSAVTLGIFSNFDRFGLEPSTRIAMVRTDPRVRRILELGIKVARAKGWQLQAFADEQEALLWLNAGPSDS